ncbi:MAG: ATP-binding protein [Fusobacteriota bacterium]
MTKLIRNKIIKYLFTVFLLMILFLPVSKVDPLVFFVLIDIMAMMFLSTVFLIKVDPRKSKQSKFIEILKYGFVGYFLFSFLAIISFANINFLDLNWIYPYEYSRISNFIFGISLLLGAYNIGRRKIKKNTWLILIIVMLLPVYYFISINQNLENMDIKVVDIYLSVIYLYSFLLICYKEKLYRHNHLEIILGLFSIVIGYLLIMLFDYSNISRTTAHILKLVATYYFYKDFLEENVNKYLEDVSSSNMELKNKIYDINMDLRRYKLAIDQSSLMIMLLDLDGNIEYVNDEFATEKLLKKEDILYDHISEFEPLRKQIIKEITEMKIGEDFIDIKNNSHIEKSRNNYQILLEKIRKKEEWEGELVSLNKNDELYWDYVILSLVKDENGNLVNLLLNFEDITARKNLMIDREHQLSKLKDLNKSRNEFWSKVSHEMKTPLHGILGSIELLMKTDQTLGQSEFMNIIEISANSLLSKVNEILNFSKIEAKKVELNLEEFNIIDLLENSILKVRDRIYNNDVDIFYHINQGIDCKIIGDKEKLDIILMNLIENAVTFTKKGEIEISVNIDESENNSHMLFEVRDTGIGIEKDSLDKVFNEFYQEKDIAYEREDIGTGLGLAIVKKTVEFLGGKIWVESVKGVGSTFYFELTMENGEAIEFPVSYEEDKNILIEFKNKKLDSYVKEGIHRDLKMNLISRKDLELNSKDLDFVFTDKDFSDIYDEINANKYIFAYNGKKLIDFEKKYGNIKGVYFLLKPWRTEKLYDILLNRYIIKNNEDIYQKRFTVLLVDDNKFNRKIGKEILTNKGLSVILGKNGKEAVEIYQTEEIDLILMDIRMPILDGRKAAHEIRKIAGKDEIPIIAITANVIEENLNETKDEYSDFNGCLKKPMDTKKVDEILSQYLTPKKKIMQFEDLKNKIGDNEDFIRDMVFDFIGKNPEILSILKKNLEEKNLEKLEYHLHKYKGVLGHFSVPSLVKLVSDMEEESKKDNLKSWKKLENMYTELEEKLEQVKKEVNSYFN